MINQGAIDHFMNTKALATLPLEFTKDPPSIKMNQGINDKNIDNLLSGRRHLEKTYNKKNKVIVTHDNKNIQLI